MELFNCGWEQKPASTLLLDRLETDERGYILAGEDGITNHSWNFCRWGRKAKILRQVVTAVADGANCVQSVERYLQSM
jgi:thioredoxin reductase (NADPH)